MKVLKINSKTIRPILCTVLTAVLLLGTVTAFAGARASLQGGSIYFDQLVETTEETIIRTKVNGNQAQDVSQKINVENIKPGSEIVLSADENFEGTILGTVTRNELNDDKTRITKSSVEATISGEKVYAGKTNANGITAGQSMGISFDNESLQGATLGDSKVLYELQILFSPKNQKPFYYTYYIRLVGDEKAATAKPAEKNEEPNENPVTPPADNSQTPADANTPADNSQTPADANTPADNSQTPADANTPADNSQTPADANTPVEENPADTTPAQNVTLTPNQNNAVNPPANTTNTATPSPSGSQNKNMAIPSSTQVAVNGKMITCEVYEINDYNYFKLRDFAAALNGTTKGFSVTWDSSKNNISLHTRAPYQMVGGELTISENYQKGGASPITPMKSFLLLDNTTAALEGYIIKSNSYFKVRDLAEMIGAQVTYDFDTDTMHITTK